MKGERRPPLGRVNRVFVVWAVVGLGVGLWFLGINDTDGDYGPWVVLIFDGWLIVTAAAVLLSWLVARFVLTESGARLVLAWLGPPVLVGLIPLVLWLA